MSVGGSRGLWTRVLSAWKFIPGSHIAAGGVAAGKHNQVEEDGALGAVGSCGSRVAVVCEDEVSLPYGRDTGIAGGRTDNSSLAGTGVAAVRRSLRRCIPGTPTCQGRRRGWETRLESLVRASRSVGGPWVPGEEVVTAGEGVWRRRRRPRSVWVRPKE